MKSQICLGKRIITLIVLLLLFNSHILIAGAPANLSSSYNILKNDPLNQQFIQRLTAAGAGEEQIESFLNDLDSEVSKLGILDDENFDSLLYQALKEVITWRKHNLVFQALMNGFNEEVNYILTHKELHPNLTDLRNAVHDSVLGQSSALNPVSGSGSGSGAIPAAIPNPTSVSNIAGEKPTDPPAKGIISSQFLDINGHWACAEIENMLQLKLVSGVSPSEFLPDRNITRAEFAALLNRTLGIKPEPRLSGYFNDVYADKWYFMEVNQAAAAGLLSGYSPRLFGPDDPITREQMAVMIGNAMSYREINSLADSDETSNTLFIYADQGSISSWARSAIAIAGQKGILRGRDNGCFDPAACASRAEATVMLLKLYRQL